MRVKVLLNLGREWPVQYRQDQIVDLPDAEGSKLIAANLALALPPAEVEIKAKPAEQPADMTIKAEEPAAKPLAPPTPRVKKKPTVKE